MTDQQLAGHFWLHEAPCWHRATAEDIRKLQETVARVLEPIRKIFGPTIITSWKWWRDGCIPRTGSHAHGGTVDFVCPQADLFQVFEWGNVHLMPTGYIGRWIYEPDTPTQGEHIHMAPREDHLAATGDPSIQSLVEDAEGDYHLYASWDEGTFAQPYELDPLVVTAEAGMGTWLGLGLLFGLLTIDFAGQASGGWTLDDKG